MFFLWKKIEFYKRESNCEAIVITAGGPRWQGLGWDASKFDGGLSQYIGEHGGLKIVFKIPVKEFIYQ